ncbi:spore coat U domain-containing protein [uncultured Castellaniella sp.]|uniref:Csu type fimbrial protein n=1 Tax=uncultured Castellaniella sp. TaxID=647907 RepID=UPI00262DF82A|nr:spore coat U domain-containing protein [uncultured Castellaniella sp.]
MKRFWSAIVLGMAAMACAPAWAQSCSASASAMDFGGVSPIRLAAVDAMGSVAVTCQWPPQAGSSRAYAHVCLSLGSGTSSTSLNPRYLANGGQTMRFNLYRDAARSQIWGSVLNILVNSPIAVPALRNPSASSGGTARTTVSYYGRIAANQPSVPLINGVASTYLDNFSGVHTALSVSFDNSSGTPACSVLPVATFPFVVQAQVINDCTISATDLNFGSVGVLSQALQASSSLNVRCTNGNAWRISLSGGAGGDVLARRMQRVGGSDQVRYQLYTAAARSVIWGDGTGGTSLVSGTGTGQAQTVGVFGTVPAQATPRPGTYSDTVIATVNF